jgi:hypothetical protein
LGIAHIEVMTLASTYSNCAWMVLMWLFDPPCDGTAALAAFVARCFKGALLSIEFFAVCFILAIMKLLFFNNGHQDDETVNVDVSFFHCVFVNKKMF